MTRSLLAEDPDALVAPFLLSAGTDAKHFRKLGMRSYGFVPAPAARRPRLPDAVPRRRRAGAGGRAGVRRARLRPLPRGGLTSASGVGSTTRGPACEHFDRCWASHPMTADQQPFRRPLRRTGAMSSRRPAQVARTGALLGALLLAAPLGLVTLAGPPAQAELGPERAAPTCNGLALTAEGSPNGTVIGTAGDDVILTRGATRVDAGAGDDSICVTGKGTAVINAGPGDDFVGARAHKGKSFVEPRLRRRRVLRRRRERPGLEPGGVQPDLTRRQRPHRHRRWRRLRHQRQQHGPQHRRRHARSGRRRPGDLRLVRRREPVRRPGHQHLPAVAGSDRERRLGLRQRDRAGVEGRRRPDRVVVVPALRPDRAARAERPLPRQPGARVGGGRRHVPRRAARPGRRRPPHGRRRRVQQPPGRRRAADRRPGERPAQGRRPATTC